MYEGNQASILNEEVGNYGVIYEDVIAQELMVHKYNLFFTRTTLYKFVIVFIMLLRRY